MVQSVLPVKALGIFVEAIAIGTGSSFISAVAKYGITCGVINLKPGGSHIHIRYRGDICRIVGILSTGMEEHRADEATAIRHIRCRSRAGNGSITSREQHRHQALLCAADFNLSLRASPQSKGYRHRQGRCGHI